MKKYRGVIIWSLVSVAAVCFIFSNSIAGRDTSNDLSSGLAGAIYELISPMLDVSFESFHQFVRKAAHFAEFAVLGTSLWMLMRSVRRLGGELHATAVLFASLAVAVADEFIQSFTGRGSAVGDVVLDFAGATGGIVITVIILYLANRKQPSKRG